jgi:hypothetical protein
MIPGRAHYDYLELGSLTSRSIGAPNRNPSDPRSSCRLKGAAKVALNRADASNSDTLCALISGKPFLPQRGPHGPFGTVIPVIFRALPTCDNRGEPIEKAMPSAAPFAKRLEAGRKLGVFGPRKAGPGVAIPAIRDD